MYTRSSCSQNLKTDTVKINLRSKKKIHMKKDFSSKTKILNTPSIGASNFGIHFPVIYKKNNILEPLGEDLQHIHSNELYTNDQLHLTQAKIELKKTKNKTTVYE